MPIEVKFYDRNSFQATTCSSSYCTHARELAGAGVAC